ncbi:putative PIF1 DNA helicase/replication protein A1-like protein [Tanacetum coccineum]
MLENRVIRGVGDEWNNTNDGHNPVKRISELHPSFMALQYPLLFPYGEDGFQLEIPRNVPATTKRKYMSLLIYTIEFQKCGLPHCHALIFLHKDDKISSTDEIDHVISAELPSEVDDPIGFEAVRTHMMHGLCGDQFRSSPYMSRDGCTKGYPKEYCEEMFITHDGWLRNKRSNNGSREKVGQRDTMLDKRFVVPHNIDLIVLIMVIEGQTNHNNDNNNSRTPYHLILHHADEIEQYLNCRYISACEACWKLLCFEMHYRSIAVERLPFHEEGCNIVYFRDDDDVENVLERATNAMSKFTGWMRANEIYPEGRHLLYADYHTEFTWHARDKEWRSRKSGMSIGRIYYVHPSMGEIYYLRMLLNHVIGATSHKFIRTVIELSTHMSECKALNLLGDDIEYHAKLFRDTFPYISEDITHKNHRLLNNQQLVFTNREIQNYTLLELETILNGNNKSLLDFAQLPQIDYSLMNNERNRLIATERMDNMHKEWAWFTTLYCGLNSEQRVVYDNIMLAVNENNGRLFLCARVEDEASLQHRRAFEAVDRTFRKKKIIRVKMKVVVLGGDFRQILPVIPNAPRAMVVASTINKSSAIWDNCKLLPMGDGTLPSVAIDNEDEATWIEIPDDLLLATYDNPIEDIVSSTFPNLLNRIHDIHDLKERCILCLTNDVVDSINTHVLQSMPSEMHVLHSAYIICSTTKNLEEMQTIYPTEFLNILKFSGVPNHNLELKACAPFILLRNTGLQRGLCNGTRLINTQITHEVLEAQIITGSHIREKVFIGRIDMTPTNSSWPFPIYTKAVSY